MGWCKMIPCIFTDEFSYNLTASENLINWYPEKINWNLISYKTQIPVLCNLKDNLEKQLNTLAIIYDRLRVIIATVDFWLDCCFLLKLYFPQVFKKLRLLMKKHFWTIWGPYQTAIFQGWFDVKDWEKNKCKFFAGWEKSFTTGLVLPSKIGI